MIVRGLTASGDWTFGRGVNDYLKGIDALRQNIKTRLSSFLGDCFFDVAAGIDWFNFLGSKNQSGLDLALRATILNTQNVTGIVELSLTVNLNRMITIEYAVTTTFVTNVNPTGLLTVTTHFILTEDGDILTTEDGDQIET